MLNSLKPKSEFSKNVLTLMTGTTIAQAIPIAISPILTRIYTPEDFGIFALYMSIVSILSVLATGRYELAIILPKEDAAAANILFLSILISCIISIIIFIIIFIYNFQISNFLGNSKISNWLYFVPLSIVLTGIYQSFNYWSNRKKQYKSLAKSRISQSGVVATTNLSMGINNFGASGLITGTLLGQSTAIIFLWITTRKTTPYLWKDIKVSKFLKLAKEYIDFPKFSILSDFFTTANTQVSILFISKYFTLTSVGYFSFILRVISIPTSILSSAIGDIFKQQASEYYALHQECHNIYKNTFKKLFVLAILPFSLLFVYAPQIFMFVFGEKWYVAGEYAQLLIPMFFLQFISSPLSAMFYIAQKQAIYLKISAIMLTSMLSLLLLIYTYNLDIKYFLLGYSLIYSFIYLINIFITYKLSKKTI